MQVIFLVDKSMPTLVTGEHLLKFLTDVRGAKDAEEAAQHLLEAKFLRKFTGHPESGKVSFDDSLYIVTGLEAQADSRCLNTFKMSSSVLTSPDLLAQQIRNKEN